MKTVLITGASGALGSALVPLLTAEAETNAVLLIRAESAEHLRQRREQLIEYLRKIGLDEASASQIELVPGDISQPGLGLTAEHAERLVGQVTHVVHSAGNVKLNQPLDEARRTAVGSATGIVDFVRRCQENGRFKKLEFVSTVGVAGRRPGLVPEAAFLEERAPRDFHNTYEAAKWEAERYVLGQMQLGLPATIHRPSMIVGDSRNGHIIHFQVFYFLTDFLLGRRTGGLVPQTGDTVLDIIPVDYVARAIHLSTTQHLGEGEIWHLCSGPEHSKRLVDLVERLQVLLVERGEPTASLRRLPLGLFRTLIKPASMFAPAKSRRFFAGLPFLLDYLGEHQFFDNQQTDARLREHGLHVPEVGAYLGTIMQPYWDRKRNTSPTSGN